MSPSKSKSKDKKAGKEPQKALSKHPGAANAGSSIPASAYNPLSGTFHALEVVPTSSASPLHSNGRFRNIDETDDHSGGVEYDSVSNNDSWSGESEDHKEKTSTLRQETIPGADNDKREKIRQKNERKHQRQKERRAQESHERCTSYLMSRKLEALAQQLVAMGFQHERATMALMFNEGKVEESVSWLFEVGEDEEIYQKNNFGGGNLKIDISEELARMTDMELRYKCTRQEVERAIVASEGDLDKAAESLRDLKLDPPSAPPKPEETGDPPMDSNGKPPVGVTQNIVRPPQLQQQQKPNTSPMLQQRRDDKDFNYTKTAVPVAASPESSSKNLQPLKKVPPKMEWAKPQQNTVASDKRWANAGPNPPVSHSVASSPLQVSPPPAKSEPYFVASGNDFKALHHPGSVREPVIMMQRPQSASPKPVAATTISTSPVTAGSWYAASNTDTLKSNGFIPHIPSTRNLSPNDLNLNQMFHQPFVSGTSPGDSPGSSRGNGIWSRTGTSPTLAAASSLGLFSGLGGSTCSSGSSSPFDWSTAGSMAQLDYTSIDWSLDRGLSSPRTGGLWMGAGTGSFNNGTKMYDSGASGFGAKMVMRSAVNGSGVRSPGLQEGAVNAETGANGSQEWTSPFEGKDLFSLPRQFVSSPSL